MTTKTDGETLTFMCYVTKDLLDDRELLRDYLIEAFMHELDGALERLDEKIKEAE